MANESAPRPVMSVLFVLGLVFAAFVALWVTALTTDFHSSDAAGNGMAQGFAFFGAIVFWVVIAVLLVLCGVRNGFGAVRVLAFVGVLALAITSQFMTMSLLSDMRSGDPYEQSLWVSVGVTMATFLLYLVWAFFPAVGKVPAMGANAGLGAIALAACMVPWVTMGPVQHLQSARMQAYEDQRAADQAKVNEIQALPPDAALAVFLPYTDLDPSANSEARQAALDRMKAAPKKQAVVEELLGQGDTRVLRVLRNLEVEVTPKVCAGGKKTAAVVAEQLKPHAGMNTFDELEPKLNGYMDGMQWLNETGCDLKPEFGLVEQTVRMYPESSPRTWSLNWLQELQGKPRQP